MKALSSFNFFSETLNTYKYKRSIERLWINSNNHAIACEQWTAAITLINKIKIMNKLLDIWVTIII